MKYSLIYSASLLFSLVAAVHSAADTPYSRGKRLLRKRQGISLDNVDVQDLVHKLLRDDPPFNPEPSPSGSSTDSATSSSSSASDSSSSASDSSTSTSDSSTSTTSASDTATDSETGSTSVPSSTGPKTTDTLPATSTTPPDSGTGTPTSTPTPSTSCIGALGIDLFCTTDSGTPAPTSTGSPSTTDPNTSADPTGTPDPTSPTVTTPPTTTTPTTSPTGSPSTSCLGVLGVDLVCTTTTPTPTEDPSTTPNPTGTADPTTSPTITTPPTTTPTTSPTTGPTTSCIGVLGLDLICTPTNTGSPTSDPTSEPTQPPTSVPPTSVPPTITSDPPTITSEPVTSDPPTITSQPPSSQPVTSDPPTITSESSTVVISFPGSISATTTDEGASTTTDAATTTVTVATSISIGSDLSYVASETTLAFTSVPTTALPTTLSDPDSNPTSLADSTPTAATTFSVAPLPTGLPARIYPKNSLDTNSVDTSKYTLISILFDSGLNWPFVVQNDIASGQIFLYMPNIIAVSLGITTTDVLTLALQVYIPSTYKSTTDSVQLGTMFLAYIPSDRVNDLAALIKAKSSVFYTGLADPIATQLAGHVNSGFSLKAVSDPNNTSGTANDNGSGQSNTSTSSGSSKSRQDAIIGVVSALGAAALLVLAFLVYRSIQRKKEMAHRRLSDPPEMSEEEMDRLGYRPQGRDFDRDSLGGQRRRSFYFAEDSLRGFEAQQSYQQQQQMAQQAGQGASYSYLQDREGAQGMSRRNVGPTLVPGAISAPILRENTMNW